MNKDSRFVIGGSVAVSAAAFVFLVWLIYIKQQPDIHWQALSYLPAVNSFLNACSATALVAGIMAIKRGRQALHKVLMVSALVFSTVFLITYIVYHALHGDTPFHGQGPIRWIYFFILSSHILLTIGGLPLILSTFGMALFENFPLHKKLARWTFPIWLYVSVTGVLIYFLLKMFG